MEIEKAKFDAVMLKYRQCSGAGIEKKTAEAFADAVKKSVTESQRFADGVVNFMSARKHTNKETGAIEEDPPELGAARDALNGLAKSVGPVVEHWRPFIEASCDALEVDVSKVLPKGMVPDPDALEKALDQAHAEIEQLTVQRDQADDRLEEADKVMKAAQTKMADLQSQLDSCRKAQAELASDNAALKAAFANATAAGTSQKPG